MAQSFDRRQEDTGNIVMLEHLNVRSPDQRITTLFYIMGMGFTRDPYLVVGVDNMWVNIGRTQIHLPTGVPQKVRGTIGLVVPDLAALRQRLQMVAPRLAETQFRFTDRSDFVDVTCPQGNHYRCHAPAPELGGVELGLAYIEFLVPEGTAEGIGRFYRDAIRAFCRVESRHGATLAVVEVGRAQRLLFRETAEPLPDYDGHHIQVYVTDFSGPHRFLSERGLVSEESDQYQYRFEQLIDPEGGRPLYTLEHEVRSLTHPLYGRPMVNRNPAQTNTRYARGLDAFRGTF